MSHAVSRARNCRLHEAAKARTRYPRVYGEGLVAEVATAALPRFWPTPLLTPMGQTLAACACPRSVPNPSHSTRAGHALSKDARNAAAGAIRLNMLRWETNMHPVPCNTKARHAANACSVP